jgi:ribosomal protein S18 acetylase RimI-like enzyme
MRASIRNYHPSDLVSLYRICLKTGNSGEDATELFEDPDILGHYYAGPYAVLEPDLCFVLTCNEKPCGYIIGTRDSQKFYDKCEQEWFPVLREQYPMPADNNTSLDARIARLIHQGHKPNADLLDYPAHLHIDILPEGQGQGMGRKLTDTFVKRLKELNVSALHLQVGKRNPGAIKFYQKYGFEQLKEYEYSIAFGIRL